MIIGIGTDIIEVERVKSVIDKYGIRFLTRVFTQLEQEYCEMFGDKKYLHYAARFAAKESFSKAIGTGITEGFKFNEVGIINNNNGKPDLVLTGLLFDKYSQYKTTVSLSHTDNYAVAYVIMEEL